MVFDDGYVPLAKFVVPRVKIIQMFVVCFRPTKYYKTIKFVATIIIKVILFRFQTSPFFCALMKRWREVADILVSLKFVF